MVFKETNKTKVIEFGKNADIEDAVFCRFVKTIYDRLTVLALQCSLNLITDEQELREIIAVTRPGP
jgi:hypothetical protein